MRNVFGFITKEGINEDAVIEIARNNHCGIETQWFVNGSGKKMLGIKLTCNGVFDEAEDFDKELKEKFNVGYKPCLVTSWNGLKILAPEWK